MKLADALKLLSEFGETDERGFKVVFILTHIGERRYRVYELSKHSVRYEGNTVPYDRIYDHLKVQSVNVVVTKRMSQFLPTLELSIHR